MFIFYFLEEVKTKHYFGRKTCLAPGYLIKFNRSIKLYKTIDYEEVCIGMLDAGYGCSFRSGRDSEEGWQEG